MVARHRAGRRVGGQQQGNRKDEFEKVVGGRESRQDKYEGKGREGRQVPA